jgi:hypothetical protein
MRFASRTKIKINQLLDGEPLKRILPKLTGRESEAEILKQLEKKRKGRKLFRNQTQYRPQDW